MYARFFDKRFIIVAGKGGVGKSVLSAAIGLAMARRGRRTIVAELDTSERVSVLFGAEPAGYQVQELADRLYAINIRPPEALREYGLMKLKVRALYNLVFENDFMRRLVAFIPGMNELLLVGKAWYMEQERDRDGHPVWDAIVVDAPATGHGISLLRLPQVILSAVDRGPMAEETRKIRALLTDPQRTAMHLVTLPEEMPATETEELYQQVRTTLQVPLGVLFVNQVLPEPLTPQQAGVVRDFRAACPDPGPPWEGMLACARHLATRRALQGRYLERLAHRVPMPQVHIPFLFSTSFGRPQIECIADHVERGLELSEVSHA